MSTTSRGDGHRIRARGARGDGGQMLRLRGADAVAPYLDDAAHYPGGHCEEVCLPRDEAQVAALLRESTAVLAVGAQSSLTGGATPAGGTVISLSRMNGIARWGAGAVTVGPGILLAELEPELRARGLYYPPVPTYDGASVGGTVATNAAGAATFKYGTTRRWVRALTIVLACGEVIDVRRGEVAASPDGCFEIALTGGDVIAVQIPTYTMPAVPKHSAGYWAEPGMDLIDLFIGSEGTLGVVTEVELAVVTPRPESFAAFVPMRDDAAAVALVADLREASHQTREHGAAAGIDVAAVEYMDARCLELLREDGAEAGLGFELPDDAGAALLLQAEVDPSMTRKQAFEELARAAEGKAETPLARLAVMLADHGVLESAVPVLPGETSRRDDLARLREAVPEGVNRRVRAAQRDVDRRITKSGGDVIVPFERFEESLARYREILGRRCLDHAIWGHISDGNVHPNVIATSGAEMDSAREAQLEIGQAAIELGGSPMSEHGVGRNAIKQALLVKLYGEEGVAEMRRVKKALDPAGLLAPGVLFPATS